MYEYSRHDVFLRYTLQGKQGASLIVQSLEYHHLDFFKSS